MNSKLPTRALITGASSGIGAEFARVLAARGVNLILAARRTEQLTGLSQELEKKFNVQVEIITIDLTLNDADRVLFEACTKEGKIINMVINNAGIGPYRPFVSTELNDHLKVLNLNIVSLTKITHLFIRHMQEHAKPSWILNVASIASYQLIPNYSVYCGSKFFVRTFSEILGHELAGTNISVSCLCPGATATEFMSVNNMEVNRFGSKFLMSAARVARIGINGTLSGKRVIIPGISNQFLAWISSFLPNRIAIPLASKTMSAGASRIN